MQVTISLTSPLMREDPASDKDKQAGGKPAEKGQRSQSFQYQKILGFVCNTLYIHVYCDPGIYPPPRFTVTPLKVNVITGKKKKKKNDIMTSGT